MITKMTKYSFILLSGDREDFLSRLQDLGVVDITRSTKPIDDRSSDLLLQMDAKKAEIEQIQKGSDNHLKELNQTLTSLQRSAESLRPWGEYDQKALLELGLSVHFYAIPAKRFDPEWESLWALSKISEDSSKVYFVIVGDNEAFPFKEEIAPEQTITEAEEQIAKIEKEIAQYSAHLASRKSEIPSLQAEYDTLAAELSKYLANKAGESAAEDALVLFEGFAPSESDTSLKSSLDTMDIVYIDSPATQEDQPPIKLKNNAFTRQFELLTGMYGMPVYNEFDPTIFLSIFFLLFFAICMGDAGYGILLVAIGFAFKGKEGGLAKLWSLIITLGVATFVVGFFMGGFFGMNLVEQTWVPDVLKNLMISGQVSVAGSTYDIQMILSLVIGVFHICLALITKAVWAIRNDGVKHSLGTLGWTLLIIGGIIALSIGMTGIISQDAMKWSLIIIASISALGIYIFNKWGRNPLVNIGSGLWDTYNTVSGLMGDLLSYIRLYALGLSGGMLGSTFNQIAEMVKGSDPTWQWLPFVLILLFGHALNLAMSCLGAFVHPLRLNFVEFFKNSSYQGRGKAYNPLTK